VSVRSRRVFVVVIAAGSLYPLKLDERDDSDEETLQAHRRRALIPRSALFG
jgi:hypothetical protein